MTNKPSFVIINTKGRAENLDSTRDWTWENILEKVYLQGVSADGSPLPHDLYLNGKRVATGLWGTAWEWGRERNRLRDEAAAMLAVKFPPPW